MTPKIYIGSTIQPLHRRFKNHKLSSNSCMSRLITQYADAIIEELHILECKSIKELRDKEEEIIFNNKDIAVNYRHVRDLETKIANRKVVKNTVVSCEFCNKTYTKANKSAHMKKYHL
jgi:phage FluMu protein Com